MKISLLFLLSQRINVQRELKPYFIKIEDIDIPKKFLPQFDNPNYFTKASFVARKLNGSNSYTHSLWREVRDYHSCYIFIRNCEVKSCFAKGWGQSGDGGAVCAINSQVKIENNLFEGNQANSGGSIAVYNSHIIISRTTFSNDIGYISAGSLVAGYIGYENEEDEKKRGRYLFSHVNVTTSSEPYFCQILDTAFIGSQSFEFYGGAFFHSIPEILFRNVSFTECHAGTTGGAIGFLDSSAYLYECKFEDNYCKKLPLHQEGDKSHFERKPHIVSSAKGGGAIYFSAPHQPEDYWNYAPLLELVTEKCNFSCNHVHDVALNSAQQKPGYDILFDKTAIYRSYNDHFSRPKDLSYSIYPESETLQVVQYGAQYEQGQCEQHWETTQTDEEASVELYTYSDDTTPNGTEVPTPLELFELPAMTSSRYFHSTPSVLTMYPFAKIQSPSASLSQSPTCSTWGGIPEPGTPRTHISTETPTFYWAPNPTPGPTQTAIGATWPDQTPSSIPDQTRPGYLPGIPTPSWWGESQILPVNPTISFYGEPSQSLEPEANPTELSKAPVGVSYRSVTLTYSKSVSLTVSTTQVFIITDTIVQSYSAVTNDGRTIIYTLVDSSTSAVLVDSYLASKTIVTNLYFSIEYSIPTPSETKADGMSYIEVVSQTLVETLMPVLTSTAKSMSTYVETNICDAQGNNCNTTYTLSYYLTNGLFPVYISTYSLANIHFQSIVPNPPSAKALNNNVILIIAAVLAILAFGIAVGVLYMLRKQRLDNEKSGDDYDSTPSEVEDDENDGVTATIDVPNEEIDETMNEVDNWL